MAVVCVAAIGAAAGLAAALGGDSKTIALASTAVGIGAITTFLPVLFGGKTKSGASNFGLLVLFASGVRTLLILAVAMFFAQTREVMKSPFWLGAMTGAGLILIAESALSISLLSRMERLKTSTSTAHAAN